MTLYSPDRLVLGIWMAVMFIGGLWLGVWVGQSMGPEFTVQKVDPDGVEPVRVNLEQKICDRYEMDCESVRLSGKLDVFYVSEEE